MVGQNILNAATVAGVRTDRKFIEALIRDVFFQNVNVSWAIYCYFVYHHTVQSAAQLLSECQLEVKDKLQLVYNFVYASGNISGLVNYLRLQMFMMFCQRG